MIKTRILHVPSVVSSLRAATDGAEALQEGKIVGFPTETVYGLAALASNAQALERLRELKSRPKNPFSVHLASKDHAGWYVKSMPSEMRRLIDRAWPGPVTIIASVGGVLGRDDFNRAGLYDLLTHNDTIGLRCPDEPVTSQMLGMIDWPVVAPSANLAGKPSPRCGKDVLSDLDGKIDLLIDTGPAKLGCDSTIVAISPGNITMLRQGVYDLDAIDAMIRRKYLFVCTGNTCRSPMAEGIAAAVCADRLHCDISELPKRLIEFESAGVFAGNGSQASTEAVRAAKIFGADISQHRSQNLTSELIRSVDMVFCMTESHFQRALELSGDAREKVRMLDKDAPVCDPIGGSLEEYLASARHIEHAFCTYLDDEQL